MSQYPQYPQYPQGPYPQGPMDYSNPAFPYGNPLAPAKRAGVLQMVLSAIGVLFGFCIGIVVVSMWDQVIAQQRASLPPNIDTDALKSIYTAILFFMAGYSIVLLILGVFVAKGSKGATITSIVLAMLASIYFAFNTVVILQAGNPVGILISVGALGVFIWLLAWLFQAVTAINRNTLAQSQYAQYQQYYQQQQQVPGQPYPGYPSQQPQAWQQPQWPAPGQQQQQQQNWPPQPPQA